MNIANFLNSLAGMYIIQSFVHSLIAAIIVDRAIRIWGIGSPAVKQRFRFIVVLLPILSFPLYQFINPDRGSIQFRLDALLDTGSWLSLVLWERIPLSLLLFLILLVTALIFLLQELVPILRHILESRGQAPEVNSPEEGSVVADAIAGLPVKSPGVFILEDDDLLLFSSTGKSPAIFLSSGLARAFSLDEMQAALAHEISHITRSRRPLLIAIFVLRVLMFFNPVVLLEFRRIVQEEEKICDDFALSLTGKPLALAETLKKLHSHGAGDPVSIRRLSGMVAALEEYSHNTLLASRISRLERGPAPESGGGWAELALTLGVIIAVNYFIV